MDCRGFAGAGGARARCGKLSGDMVGRIRARSTKRGDGAIERVAENESGAEFDSENGGDFGGAFSGARLRVCEPVRAGTFEPAFGWKKATQQNPFVGRHFSWRA